MRPNLVSLIEIETVGLYGFRFEFQRKLLLDFGERLVRNLPGWLRNDRRARPDWPDCFELGFGLWLPRRCRKVRFLLFDNYHRLEKGYKKAPSTVLPGFSALCSSP